MITWIQTYFQKHFRAIFAILLGVVIVTFVFTFNASGGIGHTDNRQAERPFFGYNLAAEKEGGRLIRDGAQSARLNGQYRLDENMVQQYALTRIAGLAIADELGLPLPTEKEVAAHILTVPVFRDQQGNFDKARYEQYATYLKDNPEFTIADANRVFRDDTRLVALQKLIGGPGYVSAPDIREFLDRTDSKYSISVASVDFASYNPNLTVTDEVLQKYFAEHTSDFEIAPRVRTSAVLFNATDYAPTGPLPENQLRDYYNLNQARFPAPAEPAATPGTPALPNPLAATGDNFEKVRSQVEAALRQELANRAANDAANKFTLDLYTLNTKANSPELATFLASQRRVAVPVEPFNQENPPASMPWIAYYGRQVAGLSQEKHFSEPLATPNGTIILLWNETLPPHQPTFAEVKAKVATTYENDEKTRRFFAEGQSLQAKLSAAVKSGGSFEQAATDAKLEVKTFANFSLMDSPKDLPPGLGTTLESLKVGEVAPMTRVGEKAYLVYLSKKTLPDHTSANPRYTEVRSRIMEQVSETTSYATLARLVQAELERTAPAGSAGKPASATP